MSPSNAPAPSDPANGAKKSTSPMGSATSRKTRFLKTAASTHRYPQEKWIKSDETLSRIA